MEAKDLKALEGQLTKFQTDMQDLLKKAQEQQDAYGTISTKMREDIGAMQKQIDAIDKKLTDAHVAAAPDVTLRDHFSKHEGVQKLLSDKTGSLVLHLDPKQSAQLFERKTAITISAVGQGTPGVLLPDRRPGIVPEARQQLLVRDALSSRPTAASFCDFVKVNSPGWAASPTLENTLKPQSAVTFTTSSQKVQTIATWIPASRQILDDMDELMGFLSTSLPYYVNKSEEVQMLSGNNSDPNLNGLITLGTAFDRTNLPLSGAGNWNRIDVIGDACKQVAAASEFAPTFFVVHPNDWWAMRLTKDGFGRYIMGDPMEPVGVTATGGTISGASNLFGITPIVTTSIAAGTFLVGNGSNVCVEIRDRMGIVVEIATQHEDYFARNMVAIRCEKRVALVTYRPGAFIQGTIQSSPVS